MIAEIRYLNSTEDVLACIHHDNSDSPLHRKAMYKGRIQFTLTPILGILLVALYYHEFLLLIFGPIISIPFWFIHPAIAKKQLDRTYRSILDEGKSLVLFGEHKLGFNDKSIIEETPLSKSELSWGAIDRIDILSDCTYIYTVAGPSYIIPKNAVIEGEYIKFIDLFKETFLKSLSNYRLQRTKGVIRWTRAAEPGR